MCACVCCGSRGRYNSQCIGGVAVASSALATAGSAPVAHVAVFTVRGLTPGKFQFSVACYNRAGAKFSVRDAFSVSAAHGSRSWTALEVVGQATL
jgi:hypothetical protein